MNVLLCAYMCKPDAGSENAMGWNNALAVARHHTVDVITADDPEKRAAIEAWLRDHPGSPMRFHYVPVPDIQNPFQGKSRFKYFVDNWYYSRRYVGWSSRANAVAKDICHRVGCDLRHHVSYSGIYHGSCLTDLPSGQLVAGPVGSGVSTAAVFNPYLGQFAASESLRTFFLRLSLRFPWSNHRAKRLAKQSAVVLCANSETELLARRLGAKRTQLVWDGSLTEGYRPSSLEKAYTAPLQILWVGSLRPAKGLTFALDVLRAAKGSVDFHLHILGDGFLAPRVPGWITERGLEGHVSYHGRVSYDILRDFYRSAHILLFSSFRDNGGNQLLESMSFGVVPIAFEQGGAPILFDGQKGGVLVPVRGLQEMKDDWLAALGSLDTDRDRLRRMSEHAYAVSGRYEPEPYALRLDALYHEIAGRTAVAK